MLLTRRQNPALNFTVFSVPHKHCSTYVIAVVGVDVEYLSSTENYKILWGIFFINGICSIKKEAYLCRCKAGGEIDGSARTYFPNIIGQSSFCIKINNAALHV